VSHGVDFLRDLALVLCVAAVTTVLFRSLRQPVVLGYLLAGLVVGPHVPLPLLADQATVDTLAELGVILVMFAVGLDFSLRRLASVIPEAGLIGIIQVSTMLWLGYLAGQLLGFTVWGSVFTGAALCISSTMVVARVFAEEGVAGRRAELTFAVLVVEDLAAVLLLALLATATGDGHGAPLLHSMVKLSVGLVALVAGGYLVVPRAIRIVARLGGGETLLVASVGVAFALALAARALGSSVALGAFLAGSLVAESGRARSVEVLVRPVRDIFAAIFFVAVGMSVDPHVLVSHGGAALLLVAVVVVGQTVSVTLGAVLSGHGVRTAVQTGLSLAQVGEFGFIFATLGVSRGVADPALMPLVVAVAVVTAWTTPWLVRRSEPAALWLERKLPHAVQTYVTLYDTWLERLRERRRTGRSPARRLLWMLIVDALALAALVIATSVGIEPLCGRVHAWLGWEPRPSRWLVLAGAAAAALPLVIGLLAASRRLGALLASLVLPPAAAGRADFGAAPRRALLVSLQVGVLLAVLVPVVALTQPFVPPLSGAPVLLALLLVSGLSFWRRATDVQAHVRAGAEVILDVLRAAGPPKHWAEAPQAEAAVDQLLPGLGSVAELHVELGTRAAGATLRELDLRGRTGAAVVAIRRGDESLTQCTGSTQLLAGDVLAVAGTHEALSAAASLLRAPAVPG
jgi:CPA2 family monovalent cation:H+ antiporter-2